MYETFSAPDIDSSLALNHMLFFHLRSATSRMRRMLSHNATANAFVGLPKRSPERGGTEVYIFTDISVR